MTNEQPEKLYLKIGEADAVAVMDQSGFTVLEGSTARKEVTSSCRPNVRAIREELIAEGVLQEFGDLYRFMKDHRFAAPSSAGVIVKGSPSNGWYDWKVADGRRLSEVRRVSRPEGSTMLSESKRDELAATCESLLGEGRVYTADQLDASYSLFSERFSPQVLAGMDGEALLEFLHDHGNRDSLVYWLEFKSDEEFDTKQFGSIAGGSALKFRIFRRKETGRWQMAADNGKPIDVSIDDAIEAARLHRDQLIEGAELLAQLPENASDDEYAELQDQMDEVVPEVSKLAWGHKYFSLLFPEKLDDFHSPDWQHFHLLKLQQLPPEGDGRYICAGRFVSAASEVGVRMNQFTASLNAVQGRLHKYWRVGTRGGDDGVSHWEMMKERNVIAVGWKQLGDLSWVQAKKESRVKLKEALVEAYPNQNAIAAGQDCSQLTQFIATISEGDWVLASDGATVLGIGRVTGEYEYDPKFEFPHQRSVEWLSLDEWKMPVLEGLRSTVREIRRHDENIVEAEKKVHESGAVVSNGKTSPAITPSRPIRLQETAGRIQSVLARKSQVILYGPPGTGKTFWAERTAFDLAAISHFGKLFANLSEIEKQTILGEGEQSGCVRMCCFHPAYGYEDFLEGYRPTTVNGQVSFDLRPGVFKKLCRDAETFPDKSFFLIVDEINRGDIPRVFGELLTTLEKDKRGRRITLPVSGDIFTVPKNVFLIGTMNTADRSISLLDAALRRRFGFIELMPDGKVLKDSTVSGIPLRAWFEALNERIRQHVGRDARNLQIGHSYLLQAGSPIKEIAVLRRAIRDDIIPLLEEYCYEDYTALANILGHELVDSDKQEIRQELLEAGREDDLVAALLTSFSDIKRTAAGLSSDISSQDDDETNDASDDDDASGSVDGEEP
ncbi:5-methylcytosine-specific restriction enzyme B [Novipirellula aureliae]|uniref:5-methylcytosine-specific restriction enzyme B n=1 Tax=Novipirellula aureliae TaxID=2527966 RepID=A0A5C6DX87_9BACT|nr:DUF4357 domain-containing protein [Novipirellula aureliae]TWU40001.1 5-methylcytosine-specific restriction enzyme B [Novipirellula aureliae]